MSTTQKFIYTTTAGVDDGKTIHINFKQAMGVEFCTPASFGYHYYNASGNEYSRTNYSGLFTVNNITPVGCDIYIIDASADIGNYEYDIFMNYYPASNNALKITKDYTRIVDYNNVNQISTAPILFYNHVNDIADRIFNYYNNRYKYEIDFIPSIEKVGDRVLVEKSGKTINGIIEKLEIDLTGGFIAKALITGQLE